MPKELSSCPTASPAFSSPRKHGIGGDDPHHRGAGFIGRHLAQALLQRGCHVRVLDALIRKFTAERGRDGLGRDVEMIEGDVRDGALVPGVWPGWTP